MLARMNLKRGEGKLVGTSPQASSRRAHSPQVSPQVSLEASSFMAHEGGIDTMSEDEKTFRILFFEISKMVKVIYEEINSGLKGESSNPLGGNGGHGDTP